MTNFDRAGHSVGMRILVFLAAMAASGCIIPLPLPGDGDGGLDDVPGCAQPGQIMAGAPAAVPFATCGSVTVTGPDGSTISTSGSTFVPTQPGEYVATVTRGSNVSTHYFVVDGQFDIDGGFERRYVDRVDNCFSLFMTAQGRLVCGRAEVSIYETDGGLHTRFPSQGVSVIGNEIWNDTMGRVEHWTDTEQGVRFDGALNDPLFFQIVGESGPGRALRGSSGGTIEVLWDGGTLSEGRRVDRLWASYGGALFEANELFGFDLCTWKAGCSTTTCESIRSCGATERTAIAAESERVWFTSWADGALRVGTALRPLTLEPTVEVSRGLAMNNVRVDSTFGSQLRPRLLSNQYEPRLGAADGFELVRAQHGIYFLYSDRVRTAQPNLTLVAVDEFTLRVIPR